MTGNPNRLSYLLQQYADNDCTRPELDELFGFIRQSASETELNQFLEQEWSRLKPGETVSHINWDRMFQTIVTTPVLQPKRRFNWRAYRRIAIAASLIVAIGIGVYIFSTRKKSPIEIVKTTPGDVKAPASNRAMITLADGQKIYLDSVVNGTLAVQGNVQVLKNADGRIVYTTAAGVETAGGVGYNTLFNPRGSKVQPLTLNDGTKVWLNSESSIKYPTSFTGSERKVEITGEAYFSVTHNAGMPFKVIANGTVIEDLGTEFNVKAYSDEPVTKTTLIQGVVKIGITLLKPGQQALTTSSGDPSRPSVPGYAPVLRVTNGVDMDQVTAWKDGYFNFSQDDITSIMKQLGRWYDAGVEFEGPKPDDLFSGIINRNNNVSQVLKLLEKTNRVHFKIEGTKIIVSK